MTRVAVVDYGMGNVFSVENALRHVGLDAYLAREPDDLDGAAGIIIPGVGAMPDAMQALRDQGLAERLTTEGEDGTPILGICLGFQLLMEAGTEFGAHEGLGLIPGRVLALPEEVDSRGRLLPVPNVRWSAVAVGAGAACSPHPFDELSGSAVLYFVHSYYVQPLAEETVIARAKYGDLWFCAAARVRQVFGCQFHPERSGTVGLGILRRFASLLSQTGSTTVPRDTPS